MLNAAQCYNKFKNLWPLVSLISRFSLQNFPVRLEKFPGRMLLCKRTFSSHAHEVKETKEKLTRKAEVVFAWLSEVSDLGDADLRIQTD